MLHQARDIFGKSRQTDTNIDRFPWNRTSLLRKDILCNALSLIGCERVQTSFRADGHLRAIELFVKKPHQDVRWQLAKTTEFFFFFDAGFS